MGSTERLGPLGITLVWVENTAILLLALNLQACLHHESVHEQVSER